MDWNSLLNETVTKATEAISSSIGNNISSGITSLINSAGIEVSNGGNENTAAEPSIWDSFKTGIASGISNSDIGINTKNQAIDLQLAALIKNPFSWVAVAGLFFLIFKVFVKG
jgi:hypothetical protein